VLGWRAAAGRRAVLGWRAEAGWRDVLGWRVVLARTVLGERLTAMRLGGLALAGACV
jgi:hypothetical protein